jgi:hypothetical protein
LDRLTNSNCNAGNKFSPDGDLKKFSEPKNIQFHHYKQETREATRNSNNPILALYFLQLSNCLVCRACTKMRPGCAPGVLHIDVALFLSPPLSESPSAADAVGAGR